MNKKGACAVWGFVYRAEQRSFVPIAYWRLDSDDRGTGSDPRQRLTIPFVDAEAGGLVIWEAWASKQMIVRDIPPMQKYPSSLARINRKFAASWHVQLLPTNGRWDCSSSLVKQVRPKLGPSDSIREMIEESCCSRNVLARAAAIPSVID